MSLFQKTKKYDYDQFYKLSINTLQGKKLSFSDFRGKVVLIVNTASQCSFTSQYVGLQQLYEKYTERNLVVLGCPCNQFANQEKKSVDEIKKQCLAKYGVGFFITEKIKVNGHNSHPVFSYLKQALPGLLGNFIKWNFTKFLIGRDGIPIKRFSPVTQPKSLEMYIRKALVT
ncbi:glutathione peroxidase [Candidatus Photodesmus blepharus]|uniref:Glutathione peroxidase n=1 Tax=Candidatus Photodesmus blepharonis TaxID=1179155 RepID=A0A084CN67_9GAMM|nr:glutathione peroxidase [Candidatus Photodesmus blepharus]KEY91246.1 glutathione peroxidase [Candidatus Photodesmus blepharus]